MTIPRIHEQVPGLLDNPELDRVLRGGGKLTLGGDAGVAAGPVGRQAEAATDGRLRAEIYSYSRSRGLFAGDVLDTGVCQMAFFRDPDGNDLMLHHRYAPYS